MIKILRYFSTPYIKYEEILYTAFIAKIYIKM